MGLGRTLTSLSAYVKPESSLVTRTLHGGVVMSVDMIDEAGEVVTDDGSTGMKLSGIESMNLHKQRISAAGKRESSKDYKAPPPDMIAVVGGMLVSESSGHLNDMEKEVQAGEGCHVYGDILVRRIEGVIRFTVHLKEFMMLSSTRKSLEKQMLQQFQKFQENHGVGAVEIHQDYSTVNVSHHIHKLQFGPGYAGRHSPLNGLDRVVTHDYGTYRYFLTIVPTTFVSALYARTNTYLYSVTEYFVPGSMQRPQDHDETNVERMPAVDLRIRMSPLTTKVWYDQRQLFHFLTRMCAVLGGCVAITQWADTVVHAIAKHV